MPENKGYEEEIFYASYYKKLLTDMNNIIIMDDSKFHRDNIVSDLLNANAFEERPAIVVSNKKKMIDKVKYVLEYQYDFMEPQYRDIKGINRFLHEYKRRAFLFDIKEKGFALTLELAMMLNEKLISIGFKPLVIIECFDELYNDELEETVEEYLEEVVFKKTSESQNFVVMSKLSLIDSKIMDRIDGNKALINQANGIIVSKGYLHNDIGVRPGIVGDLEAAISNIKNADLRAKTASVFQKMMLKLAINNEEEKLKEGFVLNINEGKIGEFLV